MPRDFPLRFGRHYSRAAGRLSPQQAAELARTFAIKIYTIGAANRGPAPFLQDSIFGKQVQYAKVDLDEPTLQEIAKISGGAYFRAEDSKALQRIYDHIDSLERSPVAAKPFREVQEHFAPWVLAAIILVLLETLALQTRLRRLP